MHHIVILDPNWSQRRRAWARPHKLNWSYLLMHNRGYWSQWWVCLSGCLSPSSSHSCRRLLDWLEWVSKEPLLQRSRPTAVSVAKRRINTRRDIQVRFLPFMPRDTVCVPLLILTLRIQFIPNWKSRLQTNFYCNIYSMVERSGICGPRFLATLVKLW